MAIGFLFLTSILFPLHLVWVTKHPGFSFTTRQRITKGLPSFYSFANFDGSKGGCFCAAGDHLTVLIHFNHEHIS